MASKSIKKTKESPVDSPINLIPERIKKSLHIANNLSISNKYNDEIPSKNFSPVPTNKFINENKSKLKNNIFHSDSKTRLDQSNTFNDKTNNFNYHNTYRNKKTKSEAFNLENSKFSYKSKSNHFIIKKKARTNDIEIQQNKDKITQKPNRKESIKTEADERYLCDEYYIPDTESLRDEQLINFFNAENLKDKNIDLEALVCDNPDYFYHIFGMCACFKCKCGQCKCLYAKKNNIGCKFNLKSKNTTYDTDFYKKVIEYNMIPNQRCVYENLIGNAGINYTTTSQTDFIKHKIENKLKEKKEFSPNDAPFSSLSKYNSEFIDWKFNSPIFFKNETLKTTINELPFYNKTTYSENFKALKNCLSPDGFQKSIKKKDKDPFFKCFPFLSETTSQANFKNYNLNNERTSVYTEKRDEPMETIPIPGQYATLASTFYRGKANEICPAKYIEEPRNKKKLIDRLKLINEEFNKKSEINYSQKIENNSTQHNSRKNMLNLKK